MSTVPVTYIGPAAQVLVHALDAAVRFGESVDAPADIAGVAPGPWQPATADDPPGWLWRDGEDGSLEGHDPGHGLLAQVDNWAPTGSPAVKAAVKARAELAKLTEGTVVVADPTPEVAAAPESPAVPDVTPEA